jgi:hypothetical protein
MGSANITYGIVIQGVCMIGSAAYLRRTVSPAARPAES